jgi:hypothetical protein
MRIEENRVLGQRAAAGATTAIPRRLRRAFPQLQSLFSVLVVGHQRHQAWRQTLDAYTDGLSDGALTRLAGEFDDLFSMTDSDQTFDVLCVVLGLDLVVADGEFPTLYQLAATIEERVSGERLTRSAA